jgi:hypothetical protein
MNLVATDKTGTRATTITAGEVLVHLRAAAIQYGEAWLGFPATHIGTNSLRANAAMAMFLAGIPVEAIQLIGRARMVEPEFMMRYVRIQVHQMTKGVTDIMTANPDVFTIEREDAVTHLRRTPYVHRWSPGAPVTSWRARELGATPTRSTRNGVGKMAPWNRGRGKRQRGEFFLGPDSDAKWLSLRGMSVRKDD